MTAIAKPTTKPRIGRPRTVPAKTQLGIYIESNGLRVEDVATRLGLTKGYVYNLCAGRYRPSVDVMIRISDMTDGAVPLESWRSR